MAPNNKQLLAMLYSRAEGNDEQFFSIALQIAAAEARQGRREAAEEIRAAVNATRGKASSRSSVAIPFGKPRGDLEGLLHMRETRLNLQDVILADELRAQLMDIVLQQSRREWLREHGKTPNRRVLFVGPPGSGKTMTAEALAGELKIPLFIIRLESLITRYMGETAAKLRLIFDESVKRRGVYTFDEFDAVGGHRGATNDVAEMRRVLNSFLQFMEEPNSTDSLIVGATNHPELLDRALLRRFDSVLKFDMPSPDQIRALIKKAVSPLKYPNLNWKKIIENCNGLSQAEIIKAADDAVKSVILNQTNILETNDLLSRLDERQNMKNNFLRSGF